MNHFQSQDGVLCAEDVSLEEVAKQYGTPTYVYSHATITRHVRVLQEGVGDLDHLICYAVKANGNLGVLELLRDLDCGFDAVSVGELARVLKIGADPNAIIVSGVGKRDDEIAAALKAGVLYICVESESEMAAVGRIAKELGVVGNVSVRVNPDVDAKTHPYISTGLKRNKFGVPLERAEKLLALAHKEPSLQPHGVTCHIGSQITDMGPFEDAALRMVALAKKLRDGGVPLQSVGLGGGLGIPYNDETPPLPSDYGAALARIIKPLGLQVVFEPGRVIVGNAGVLLTRVTRIKEGTDKRFVLLDAGMNDLARPALYQAKHAIEPVRVRDGKPVLVDVVGPVCESADTFATESLLPPLQEGDLVILRTAGAYGFVLSSQYNGRPRAAEVLVNGAKHQVVRQREDLGTLWAGELGLDGNPFDETVPFG